MQSEIRKEWAMRSRLLLVLLFLGLGLAVGSVGAAHPVAAQSSPPQFDPSSVTCSPPVQAQLPGSWQVSAPREGADFVTAGQSVTIELRDKDGTPDEDYDVMATVFAPDGSTSAATTELTDSNWASLQYPDDFAGASSALSGVYTVLWTIGPLNVACDGFVLH
jgi:hypothetical protein